MTEPLVVNLRNWPLRGILIITLLAVVVATFSYIVFELVAKPIGTDVSDCKTGWKDGRIISVTCPGRTTNLGPS